MEKGVGIMGNPIKERNIVVCILLSFVTCGIYGIVWFISLTDDVRAAGGDNDLSGGKAVLYSIITCGIYTFYWAYKMGKEMAVVKAKNGMSGEDNSVLYLILNIFGLSIVTWCLIQNDLNVIATTEQGA